MTNLIINIGIGILLLITAIQDVRSKQISNWIILAGAALLCIGIPFSHGLTLADRGFGMLVGAGVILISKATGGKIGMGDGLLLCVTGLGLGVWSNLELFALSMFAAAVVSIILLIARLANRKTSIPFVPFLFLGYILQTINSRPWMMPKG